MTSYVSSWLFGNPSSSPPPPPSSTSSTSPELPATSYSTSNQKKEQTPEQVLEALLEQYNTSALPPNSRFYGDVDPQREGKPPRVLDLWRHAWFVATKTKDIVQDVALHHLRGPRRPSWNLEMTMMAAFMRNLASHTHLVDVPTLRFAVSLSGLIPTPSDALVTPVTFRVRKGGRGLGGMLEEVDRCESGTREIAGEWVVGKRTWQRLQREWKGLQQQQSQSQSGSRGSGRAAAVGGQSSHHHSHNKVKERVVLFLHGGAYYTGSTATHRLLTVSLSKHLDARVFAINYRLAPDTRFPGPIHDAVSAWFRLTEDLGVPPGNVILAGDSAGGGLCVAVMMYLRDQGYALPGGAILMCPWVDLTMSCASWDTNASLDVITFPTDPADHMNPIACYLGPTGMTKYITHPYASPLFGSFHSLPPMLIQSGDCEVLRDEVTLMAHKATMHGVDVVHEMYEDAVHVFQLYPFLEQGKKAFRSCRKFVMETLPALQARDKEREREKMRLSRQNSSADVNRSMEGGQPSMDVDATSPSTTATPAIRAPVSPPLTPTRPPSTPLPPPTVDISEPSPTSSSPSLSSSSDNARFDDHVETALEREISGADGSIEPMVVDAYGGEEPRSRASSILSQAVPDHDDDESGSGSDTEPHMTVEREGTNDGDDEKKGMFANMPLPLPLPWRFTSSKSSSYISTLKTSNIANNTSLSSTIPLSSSALKYSGPSPSEALSGSRTTPSSPVRSKSKSFASSGTPSSPNASPPSSRPHTLRNHRRTGSALGLMLTPVSRAPPIPEARKRSPTISSFNSISSATPTATTTTSSSTASPTANVTRPASSSYLSTPGSGSVPSSRARARTTSHPDMIKLMQEYAQRGPAQSTTTYAHTPVDTSSGKRSRGTSLSGSALDHAPKSPASPR